SDPGSRGGTPWAAPDLDANGWKTMNLPTAWEAAGLPGFDGVVWFRREIELPESAAGKPTVLHLGPIDDRDTTWVNGIRVGATDEYNVERNYRIPPGVLKTGRNTIALRVLDPGGAGGAHGKVEQLSLEAPASDPISLAGAWSYRVGVALG